MLFSPLTVVLGLTTLAFAQDTSLATVKKAFDSANLARNGTVSTFLMTFPRTNLLALATTGPPIFRIVGHAGPGPFVVAIVDPDAPTPQNPTSAQIRHFLGGNFFQDFPFCLRNSTPAISDFIQPTPPAGSDPHRYIFLLFKQPSNFNDQTLVTPATPVPLFNISEFASGAGLGEPIGGTFMRVGPDPSSA
ncbi:PEBP-like protein [Phlegmacium glaucopus]|nr:PEBP-like protein [Phlegmacium glaucopus]